MKDLGRTRIQRLARVTQGSFLPVTESQQNWPQIPEVFGGYGHCWAGDDLLSQSVATLAGFVGGKGTVLSRRISPVTFVKRNASPMASRNGEKNVRVSSPAEVSCLFS